MCSICGGTVWDSIAKIIWEKSKSRGRDDHGKFISSSGYWIGNHRATPTTETTVPIEKQPVGNKNIAKYVFNGIISNDKELGIKPGEADTSVIPRTINCTHLSAFHLTLDKIIGSFAIAALTVDNRIFLAANYKPIWIATHNEEHYFSSLKDHFPDFLKPWKMEPYSVMELGHYDTMLSIKRTQSKDAIVICSSGLDSTAVAAYAVTKHKKVLLLHFDYSCQAGKKEQEQIKKISDYLKTEHKIIKISNVIFGENSPLLKNKGIISDTITGAEYAHEWVPARNLVMLSLTVAFAEANNFGHIYLGTNLEEAGAYPDNEEQFILDFKNLLYGAVQNGVKIEVHTPLGGLMKHEIIPFGVKYNAPFHLTWSCYLGGEKHCGKCGPDFMRRTAFQRNGLLDPVFKHEWGNPFWKGCKEY